MVTWKQIFGPNFSVAQIEAILMVGAFFTHMRINNPFREYIASLVMLTISGLVLYFSLCVTN